LQLLATQQLLVVDSGHVLEELLDQIDVGEDHTATAIALKTNFVEGLTR
jgi:hypothetical protein